MTDVAASSTTDVPAAPTTAAAPPPAAPAPAAEAPATTMAPAATRPQDKPPEERTPEDWQQMSRWEIAQELADNPDIKLPPNAFGEVKEGEPYPDLIKFPNEEKPPPEVWEVEPKYEWEKGADTERSYIYEERLEQAESHRLRGNEHFRLAQEGAAEEWEHALRRYRRAIYHAQFDEMQMADFMDAHRAHAEDIQRNSKLNFVACVCAMHELDVESLPAGSIDHAVALIADMSENSRLKDDPKLHFRRAQVAMLRGDLDECRDALAISSGLGGGGKDHRVLAAKLKRLQREERERARKLYGGKIQAAPLHPAIDAAKARSDARRAVARRAGELALIPVTVPWRWLLALLAAVWAVVTRAFLRLAKADGRGRSTRRAEGREKSKEE